MTTMQLFSQPLSYSYVRPFTRLILLLTVHLTMHISAQAETIPLDRIVAIVDDDVVMESELVYTARGVIRNLRANKTPLPPQDILQSQILEKLIVDQLQLKRAERIGIQPSDQQVNATIAQIQQRQQLNDAQFQQKLQQDGMSLPALQNQIRREMTIKQVQRGNVNRRIHVTEQEITNFLESTEGKFWNSPDYHLGHILIPMKLGEKQAEEKAHDIFQQLTQGADFRQLATANSSGQFALQGGDLGWRKNSQLPGLFAQQLTELKLGTTTKPFKSGAGFHLLKLYAQRGGGEKLIEQTNSSHILLETSAIMTDKEAVIKLNKIRERLLNGADFAAEAKQHSEDIGSMLKGGNMGWSNPGMFVPAFEKTMAETAIGDISKPFHTQFGWHILKVNDRRQEDMSEDMIRNQAHHLLHNRRYQEELQSWLQEIRASAYVEIKL